MLTYIIYILYVFTKIEPKTKENPYDFKWKWKNYIYKIILIKIIK